MANREALRELQGRLAERLQEAQTSEPSAGWLAIESCGFGFLLPLAEAGEIFQPGELQPVPHTMSWFLGVANLRGALTGVVDLGGFLGLRQSVPGAAREQARLVAFNPGLEINAALLVDKLAGLRQIAQLTPAPIASTVHPAFVTAAWNDASGRTWQVLSLAALSRDERFLHIATVV
ncbi:twitching motility protein PilI [Sphaerotilus hippei]|uniref:Twitching motility protein PilI n=1 Tax=Sphaerotilus hippei TaxID=744406 RepID=A0A318GXD0_9BURK|nr:chemotaxis protein CheW [Sphaerotilus hippei]PXW93855.1 twitching motility protein PilI [Sphaerotilus hippei]